MKLFDENIGKYVSKRRIKKGSLSDAAILLDTISALQGSKLIPKGVRKFSSFEEAELNGSASNATCEILMGFILTLPKNMNPQTDLTV